MRSQRWSGPLTVVSAVVIVAALSLLTVTVMSGLGDDDETATIDTDQSTTTVADTTTTTTRPRTTTTGAPTTTEAPEVLGDVDVREPGTTTTTAAPTRPRAQTAPTPTTSPTTAPTTTTTICRSSTDPACGPLVWDPQPGPYEVEVYGLELPTTATVGTPVRFAVYYIEPSGPDAHDTCATWETTDPEAPLIAGCSGYVNATCPRHGPHAPPAPSRAGVEVANELTFSTPGEHVVTLTITTASQLADGCPSPYRQEWTGTFPITVEDAPSG